MTDLQIAQSDVTVELVQQSATVEVTQQPVQVIEVGVSSGMVEIVQQPVAVVEVSAGIVGPPGPPGQDTAMALQAHIDSPTPHPAYDDIADLTLLYENGLI